jgi:WD40 repeat protein
MNFKREKTIEDISIPPTSLSILPKDSVTHSSWLNDEIFGLSSFDGYFRMYEVNLLSHNPYFEMIFEFQYNFPITFFTFIEKTSLVVLGTCDGKVILLDFKTKKSQMNQNMEIIYEFSNPVMKIFFAKQSNTLICLNSVNRIVLIDLNSSNVMKEISTEVQIMDADFEFPWLVVGLAENYIEFINLESYNR